MASQPIRHGSNQGHQGTLPKQESKGILKKFKKQDYILSFIVNLENIVIFHKNTLLVIVIGLLLQHLRSLKFITNGNSH